MVDREKVAGAINRGNELKAAGQLEGAIAVYQEILKIDPDMAEVYSQLAEVYVFQGHLAEAIGCCQQALRLDPTLAAAYKTLGNALQAGGKLEAAKRAYARAVAIMPDFATAHANLGSVCYGLGEVETAIACYQRAIALQPTLAGVYWNLGRVYENQGNWLQAVESWQQAFHLQPQMATSQRYLKLGNGWLALENLEEAIACYQRATLLQPDSAEAHSNLGNALVKRGQLEEGIASLQKALSFNSNLAALHYNLGSALLQQAKQQNPIDVEGFNAVADAFLNAIALEPDLVPAHQGLWDLLTTPKPTNSDFSAFRNICDRYLQVCQTQNKIWATLPSIGIAFSSGDLHRAKEKFLEIEQQIYADLKGSDRQIILNLYAKLLFILPHLRDNLSKNTQFSQFIGAAIAQVFSQIRPQPVSFARDEPSPPARTKPLKIGFVSPHFRRHSVGWCSADIIRELSRLGEIYLYASERQKVDDRTAKFHQYSTKFYRLPESIQDPVQALFEEIQGDRLDILVDLDSLTVPTNAELLYLQPAPICISWLGFDAPFLRSENYFLSDWHTHPPGTEKYYRERLLRMPDSFVAVSGFQCQKTDCKTFRSRMRIDAEQVVYLSVAPGKKLDPDLVKAQIKIIGQVKDSILLHKGQGDPAVIQEIYKQTCAELGVAFHRIKFIERTQTEEEHRTIYSCADVLLDSYPYNGGTHNLEALWFDLPMVTRVGEQFLSRMGYSFLKTLGIDAAIAWSWEEYVEWGVRLGKEVSLREEIRSQLVRSKHPKQLAPLWNPQKFAKDMYALFEQLLVER